MLATYRLADVTCTTVPRGPGTVKFPEGKNFWECKSSPRVCIAQYATNAYRDSEAALTKAGLPIVDHPNVLGIFKGGQRAVNDYNKARKLGLSTLVVDGHIGPQTLENLQLVLADMALGFEFSGRIPTTLDEAALHLSCQSDLIYNIAKAAGTKTSFTVKIKPGENPGASTSKTLSTGGASGKIPPPGGEKKQWGWAWWAVGGAALIGVIAVGVSLTRED